MPGRDLVDLVLYRAGVGIDINAGGAQVRRHLLVGSGAGRVLRRGRRVVLHRRQKCEGNTRASPLATALGLRRIVRENSRNQGAGMTRPIETYRVSAYNTSKLSENKIHDDSVARKFGFSGGLVPGVDVFAYMIHVPVRKWGRAFLERGVIETRFVKPVYDGEFADVTATESDGVLTIEVESRGEPCATGTASLPASAPSFSIADYRETPAVAERRP